MRFQFSVSAPGKVVLCGEYAVLHGSPAISMAVNRRASVTVRHGDEGCHTLVAPGFHDGKWRFAVTGSDIEWLDPLPGADTFRLVEQVWRHVAPSPGQAWALSLDTTAFVDPASGRKLGLGASAATTVALAVALARASGNTTVDPAIAAAAHRDYQGGTGSGVDIVTSQRGGIIAYRRGEPGVPVALAWPDDLSCRLLWSGVAASTRDKLHRLQQNPGATGQSPAMAQLRCRAEAVADEWPAGAGKALLSSMRDYTAALRRFDIDQALGIFDAGHAELADLAAVYGVVYKPCGAGGGDVGAVFGPSAAAAAAFSRRAGRLGFKSLDLALDQDGVICVETGDP